MSIFPTKILVATDGSREAALPAHTAAQIADETGSELHVVYVRPKSVPFHAGDYVGPEVAEHPLHREEELQEREAQRVLDAQVEEIEAAGSSVTQTHLGIGRPGEEIVALGEELEAGLIVLGSRGRGRIRRALMGSVSDSIVRHAHCPVLVVRWKPVVFPAKILLATDGSEEAVLAAQSAADLAVRTGSELHVTHVGKELSHEGAGVKASYVGVEVDSLPAGPQEALDKESKELLEAQLARMGEAGATVTEAHLMSGRADEEIIFLAEGVGSDLVVVGSRGLGGIRRARLGSVSDSVVRHTHCPVLVVRREGLQEPV